jgi:hypothetical protein
LTEAKGQVVVAPGLEDGQRAFKILPRFAVLPDEPMRHSGYAVSDSGLGRIGLALTSLRKLSACALIGGSSSRKTTWTKVTAALLLWRKASFARGAGALEQRGFILVPLFAHYRPAAHLVQAAQNGGLPAPQRLWISKTSGILRSQLEP